MVNGFKERRILMKEEGFSQPDEVVGVICFEEHDFPLGYIHHRSTIVISSIRSYCSFFRSSDFKRSLSRTWVMRAHLSKLVFPSEQNDSSAIACHYHFIIRFVFRSVFSRFTFSTCSFIACFIFGSLDPLSNNM